MDFWIKFLKIFLNTQRVDAKKWNKAVVSFLNNPWHKDKYIYKIKNGLKGIFCHRGIGIAAIPKNREEENIKKET